MKLAKHLAWSLIWAAAVAGCGGGGGGGGAGNADSGGSGGTLTVPVCAASNTSQGWLTDYRNTSNPLAYNQAVQGCVAGAYSTPTLAFPNTSVLLTRDNIRAMIGSPSSTTGTAPTFSFYIQTPAPNLTATRSTIELAITKGTDATRDKGVDSQVMINLNVVTQLENNKLVIRSDGSQRRSENGRPERTQGRSQSHHGPQGDRSPAGQGHRPGRCRGCQGREGRAAADPGGDEDGAHHRRAGRRHGR